MMKKKGGKGRKKKKNDEETDPDTADPETDPFFSFKFKGPGLAYEVVLSIIRGDIVMIYGPRPCAKWPDINMFRDELMKLLEPNERVEADEGYMGEFATHVKPGSDYAATLDFKIMQERVRLRHETVNKRLKQFGSLRKRFDHSIFQHSCCFYAAAVLTQFAIEDGEPLFEVEYDDTVEHVAYGL
jgi:hypothetical protein